MFKLLIIPFIFFFSFGLHIGASDRWNNPDNENPLHRAVEKENDQEVISLLRGGWRAKIDRMTTYGYAPLHLSVLGNNFSISKTLLEFGANVNQTITRSGSKTALDLALDNKPLNKNLLELLLTYGASVNDKLCQFSCSGNYEIVSCFLKYGKYIDVNGVDYHGSSALHLASQKNSLEIVELLLTHGAEVNKIDRYSKMTPLHWGVKANQERIVSVLLGNKANVNAVDKDLSTPLHLAARGKNPSIARILLAHGAIPDLKNKDGMLPLHLASKNGQENIVALLLDWDYANTAGNVVENIFSISLHLAVEGKNISIVRMLLDHGANPNFKQDNGMTALHLASRDGQVQIIDLLLERGASVNEVGQEGTTPLHMAFSQFSHFANHDISKVVEKLLVAGADVKDNNGRLALYLSLDKGFPDIAVMLINHGAKVNYLGREGKTPLVLAIEKTPNHPVVELLFKHNADVNLSGKNNSDKPLSIAWRKRDGTLVKSLLDRGAKANVSLGDWSSSATSFSSPLHEALENKDLRVVRCLLKHGALQEYGERIRSDGFHLEDKVLHYMVKSINALNNYKTVKLSEQDFWERENFKNKEKKNVNLISIKGKTYKEKEYLALLSIHMDITSLLLKYGTNPSARNLEGEYPLVLALSSLKPYPPLIKMLQEAGANLHIIDRVTHQSLPLTQKTLLCSLKDKGLTQYLEGEYSHVPSLKWQSMRVIIEDLKKFQEEPAIFQNKLENIPICFKEKFFKEFFNKKDEEKEDEVYLAGWLNNIGKQERAKAEEEQRRYGNYNSDFDVEGLVTSDDFIEYNDRYSRRHW